MTSTFFYWPWDDLGGILSTRRWTHGSSIDLAMTSEGFYWEKTRRSCSNLGISLKVFYRHGADFRGVLRTMRSPQRYPTDHEITSEFFYGPRDSLRSSLWTRIKTRRSSNDLNKTFKVFQCLGDDFSSPLTTWRWSQGHLLTWRLRQKSSTQPERCFRGLLPTWWWCKGSSTNLKMTSEIRR